MQNKSTYSAVFVYSFATFYIPQTCLRYSKILYMYLPSIRCHCEATQNQKYLHATATTIKHICVIQIELMFLIFIIHELLPPLLSENYYLHWYFYQLPFSCIIEGIFKSFIILVDKVFFSDKISKLYWGTYKLEWNTESYSHCYWLWIHWKCLSEYILSRL